MAGMFAGKVALVVGASSGIGRATAIAFAAEGARVAVAARREAEAMETVGLIDDAGGEAAFVQVDVLSEAAVEAMIDRTVGLFGGLDYAVNNAGIEQHVTPLAEQGADDWERIVGINARGAFYCMKYEVPAMLRRGGGAIVNVSSIAAHVATPGTHVYTASKHAVLGLTRSMALDYARQGIRVNEIAPGIVDTPLIERFAATNEGVYDHLASIHPIGRIGQPEEIASAALWLCSPGASFVIGHSLVVDGGLTVQ